MHLHFERNINSKCDCTILSLSWMGKVPDELPEVSPLCYLLVRLLDVMKQINVANSQSYASGKCCAVVNFSIARKVS